MMLSSKSYSMGNNFTKSMYVLSPNANFGWNMTPQPYSYFSPRFVISLTFSNSPFDPGIHDITLFCSTNNNLFPNSSFISTYFCIVTL